MSHSCTIKTVFSFSADPRYQTYSGLKGVTKFGIAIRNDLDFQTVHGTSANATKIIPFLKDLKKVKTEQFLNIDGKIFYNHSKTNGSYFYKIDDIFIFPDHPQFNEKTGKIDNSLPCKK